MDAPIQFFPKNTNANPGILFWPFQVYEVAYFPAFDGSTLGRFGPHWSGDWQTPPPEVCDILTASEWQIQFEFDPSGVGATDMPSVSLDTTIKPGQIKRKTELGGEYVIGGDGYQSVLEIIEHNFEESEEYDEVLNGIFRLQYEWISPAIEDGETIDNVIDVVTLTITLITPLVAKDENDEWAWIFQSSEGASPGLATYSAYTVDLAAPPGTGTNIIADGHVINFMDNQHDDPVDGFPVVSLSIVSHFGEA